MVSIVTRLGTTAMNYYCLILLFPYFVIIISLLIFCLFIFFSLHSDKKVPFSRQIYNFVVVYINEVRTPVALRQPTRLTTSNTVELNRRKYGVNTCLGTTLIRGNCSQTGIYSLLLLIDLSSVCCSLSR